MASSTTTFNDSYLPSDFGALLVATATQMSVVMQTTTVVNTASSEFRMPTISGEVAAGWYSENSEITLADATAGEEVVRPRKIAGLSKLSVELVNDSSPQAAGVVGDSIARSIAAGIDAAFFGSATGAGVPPKGVGALTDSQVTKVAAPAAWANIDPFLEATFKVEAEGGSLTSFIANPADAQLLAMLKRATDSNEPLLAPDATSPTTRRLAGLPLFTSSAVTPGTIIGIDATRIFTVLGTDVTVDVDRSRYFDSYSVGVRGVARVGFGFPHSKSVARISLTPAG
jgi:HK97 family phage major capsid protein